ncbi:hypothetical protein BHE74_00029242 [Ensete ventricosum]|nr:hypothetical protein BHE74_00029242 [Ensete ventricosum]
MRDLSRPLALFLEMRPFLQQLQDPHCFLSCSHAPIEPVKKPPKLKQAEDRTPTEHDCITSANPRSSMYSRLPRSRIASASLWNSSAMLPGPWVRRYSRRRGVAGTVIPGCPETYQSFQQQREGEDEHQRIHYFREGDIIALAAGVAHWCYNNGEAPVVAITVSHTSSNANQLDRQHRLELLAEALGVDKEVARKIQNPDDGRGEIVGVDRGLQLLQPSPRKGEQERRRRESNGLEEAYCTMDYMQNIGDTTLCDQYDPNAGRITVLNSRKFPVLRFMEMGAVRGSLRPNTVGAPYWNINTHGIAYALRGSCQMQVVGHRGRTVFDGELRQGQLLAIPPQYVVITKARGERYEWVSFKTNGNPMVSQIVGKASVFRGMPVEVSDEAL